jgi:hypothetical protein
VPDTHREQPQGRSYATPEHPGAPWSDAVAELERSFTFWLATTHPGGRPHVVPVLAVWHDGALHVAAGPGTQKARNLARDPSASVTTHGERFDLVLEGRARRVRDDGALAAVAEAYAGKYGWEVEVAGGALHGEGAPTAGPPPYHVHRLDLRRAFGFPTTDDAAATRWVSATEGS